MHRQNYYMCNDKTTYITSFLQSANPVLGKVPRSWCVLAYQSRCMVNKQNLSQYLLFCRLLLLVSTLSCFQSHHLLLPPAPTNQGVVAEAWQRDSLVAVAVSQVPPNKEVAYMWQMRVQGIVCVCVCVCVCVWHSRQKDTLATFVVFLCLLLPHDCSLLAWSTYLYWLHEWEEAQKHQASTRVASS
jgi:hypothetical protein